MRKASLILVEGDIALLCDYTPDLVAALKSGIPAQWRAWDYHRRLWRFHLSQEPALRDVLHSLDYMVDDRHPPSALELACRTLHIAPSAPREVAEAAYHALVRLYHLEDGDDAQTLARFNAAITEIRHAQMPCPLHGPDESGKPPFLTAHTHRTVACVCNARNHPDVG